MERKETTDLLGEHFSDLIKKAHDYDGPNAVSILSKDIRETYELLMRDTKVRKPYSTEYEEAPTDPQKIRESYRRFEVITDDDAELIRCEKLLHDKNINRQELATILFSLRVRPGFDRQLFGL